MKVSNLALVGALAIAAGAASKRAQAPAAAAASRVAAVLPPTKKRKRSGNILVRIYRDAQEDRLFAVAAGVAFYALLALAPSLAAAVSVFGLFADPAQLAKLSSSLSAVLPAEAAKLVQDEAQRLASQAHQALSMKLGIALFLSLWTSSAAVRSSFDALNVINEQEEQRSIVRYYGTSLGATLIGVFVFLLSLAVIGASPRFVSFGSLSQQTVWLYSLFRWPLFFGVAVVAIAGLYWIGPSRPPARFTRLLPGAALAALFWALGSSLFGWYVSNSAIIPPLTVRSPRSSW
jgi:membrane protein